VSTRVLLIDNHDSFVWNIAHAFQEMGARVDVVEVEQVVVDDVLRDPPTLIVIGPGPRGPAELPALRHVVTGVFAVGWVRDWRKTRIVRWLEGLRVGRVLQQMIDTIASFRDDAGTVVAALAVSFGAHSLAIAAALLVAQAMNPEGFSWTMAILIPFGFMANQVPLTPGGLGVGEAAFESLFSMAGLTGGAEVMLGWRLLLLCVGLLGLVAYLRVRGQLIHYSADPVAAGLEERPAP
jgi:hypothetical protein